MNWIFLIIAGIFEVVWATAMKYSHGFTNLTPSIITIVGMLISFFLLAHATKTLPLSIAYPVWTGIGQSEPSLPELFYLATKCHQLLGDL